PLPDLTRSSLFPYTTLFRSLRIDFVEVVQLCIFQNLCVKSCHTVYRKSIVDIHVGHMDSLVFINNVHRLVCIFLSYSLIQLFDEDRKSTRLNSSHVSISYAV